MFKDAHARLKWFATALYLGYVVIYPLSIGH